MNDGFKNKRTKKNKDKLKWNYRGVIVCVRYVVERVLARRRECKVNKIKKLKRKKKLDKEIIKRKGLDQ
jgi:antitoxin component HigA of HigAB toxin-antitoxin module